MWGWYVHLCNFVYILQSTEPSRDQRVCLFVDVLRSRHYVWDVLQNLNITTTNTDGLVPLLSNIPDKPKSCLLATSTSLVQFARGVSQLIKALNFSPCPTICLPWISHWSRASCDISLVCSVKHCAQMASMLLSVRPSKVVRSWHSVGDLHQNMTCTIAKADELYVCQKNLIPTPLVQFAVCILDFPSREICFAE